MIGTRLALFAAVAVALATASWADAWIALKGGAKARILAAEELDLAGKPKQLVASFVLGDPKLVSDRVKVIDIADQLFGRVVLVPAERKGFRLATVNLVAGEKKTADGVVQKLEAFSYARGANGVWLRLAGREPWKVAQDPRWKAPKSETVQLKAGTVYVDFFGEIVAPEGYAKALGIEMRSATAASNIPAKYAEMKELWSRINYDKLKEQGFEFVHIDNFSVPLRGRFHVRQRVFLDIRRAPGGNWPELPDVAPLEGAKDPLVAALGASVESDAARFASAAVESVVFVSDATAESDDVRAGVAVSLRTSATRDRIAAGDFIKK